MFVKNTLETVVAELHRCLKRGAYLMFTANSTDDIAIRTVSQAPVKLLDTNFYELAGGQTIHFLSEVF